MGNISNKELLTAYRIISRLMKDMNKNHDNSFKVVKNYLANMLCDQLEDGDILETLK